MCIFTFVLLFITKQRCKGKKRIIGSLSIIIAILSLLDSVFATIRIKHQYPFSDYYNRFRPIHCLEGICFYGATWLFGVKYYETAFDVEHIVSSDPRWSDSSQSWNRERKRLLKYLRWTIFVVICFTVVCESLSVYREDTVYRVISIATYSMLSCVVIGTSLIMFAALLKFIKIVSQQKRRFNQCQIAIQIIGLFLWTVARLGAGLTLLIYEGNLEDFMMDRALIVCGIVCIFGDLLHFIIIAYVIYKYSIVASNHSQDEQKI